MEGLEHKLNEQALQNMEEMKNEMMKIILKQEKLISDLMKKINWVNGLTDSIPLVNLINYNALFKI